MYWEINHALELYESFWLFSDANKQLNKTKYSQYKTPEERDYNYYTDNSIVEKALKFSEKYTEGVILLQNIWVEFHNIKRRESNLDNIKQQINILKSAGDQSFLKVDKYFVKMKKSFFSNVNTLDELIELLDKTIVEKEAKLDQSLC